MPLHKCRGTVIFRRKYNCGTCVGTILFTVVCDLNMFFIWFTTFTMLIAIAVFPPLPLPPLLPVLLVMSLLFFLYIHLPFCILTRVNPVVVHNLCVLYILQFLDLLDNLSCMKDRLDLCYNL